MKRCDICTLILGIPKTIYFNFKELSIKEAIKFPIILSHRVKLLSTKGKICFDTGGVHAGMVLIGFGGAGSSRYNPCVIENNGVIVFEGDKISFGGGIKLGIGENGTIRIGVRTAFTGDCRISVHKNLRIGSDCLISWDTQIMDNDSHSIITEGCTTNECRAIEIGNHSWIGSHCIISKGSIIPDDTVVASGSHINKRVDTGHCIITGLPIRIIKKNIDWKA